MSQEDVFWSPAVKQTVSIGFVEKILKSQEICKRCCLGALEEQDTVQVYRLAERRKFVKGLEGLPTHLLVPKILQLQKHIK